MRASLVSHIRRIEQRIAQRRQEPQALGAYVAPLQFAIQHLGFQPDAWQASVLSSSSTRQLLCCSRQSGKSTVASILAVHRSIFFPRSLILLISPTQRQSGELFRRVRDFLNVLPVSPFLVEDNKLSLRLHNGSRVVSLPGDERTIRGYAGVSLLVIDEAARVLDETYFAVKPTLAVSAGAVVALSTPFGRRGWFYHEWEDGQGWERIRISATQCPRISSSFLAEEKASMPQMWFDSEYNCLFTDTVDAVFSSEDIQRALDSSIEPLFPLATTDVSRYLVRA